VPAHHINPKLKTHDSTPGHLPVPRPTRVFFSLLAFVYHGEMVQAQIPGT